MMTKRIAFSLGVSAMIVLASALARLGVFAQTAATHGIPTAPKTYGDGKTWPIKINVREYDRKQLTSAPPLSEEAYYGRVIWVQKCAYCHDGVGAPTYKTMGPWLGAETVRILGEDTVRNFIESGDARMPAFRYQFDTKKMDAILAYLKTVPTSQKPTAAQLAARTSTRASD